MVCRSSGPIHFRSLPCWLRVSRSPPAEESFLAAYCKAVFHAEYGLGRDITDKQLIAAILAQVGADPVRWLEKAGEEATKQALKDRVDAAQAKGIFGAPTFITPDGELFWGDDRLEQALEWVLRRR
jgi:2-hydroxychromene-2-carboxylate isomerase